MRDLVRDQGLRATGARIDVLVVLHEAASPLTPEQVMKALRSGVYDKASIWRVLADLATNSPPRRDPRRQLSRRIKGSYTPLERAKTRTRR